MDVSKIKGNINPAAPVHSCRIRVGRSIDLTHIHVTCVDSIRGDAMVLLNQGVKHFCEILVGVPVTSIYPTVLVVKLNSTSNRLGKGEARGGSLDVAELLPDGLGDILGHQRVGGLDVGKVRHCLTGEDLTGAYAPEA